MTVAESDDTVKRPAVKAGKPAKRTGGKPGNERRKQAHKPEQTEADSLTDKVATVQKPESVIPVATATAIFVEPVAEPDVESEPATQAAAGAASVEHIDTSTSTEKELDARTTDTPASALDDTKTPTIEIEQSASLIKEELHETHEILPAETEQPPAPIKQKLHETSVDTATLPPPETPRPEFDASTATTEEDSISTVEIPLPDTSFDAQFDTPRPDDTDELESTPNPVDTSDPVENTSTVDVEASVDTANLIDAEARVEANNLVEAEAPDASTDVIDAAIPAGDTTDTALIDTENSVDSETADVAAATTSDISLSPPGTDAITPLPAPAPAQIRTEKPAPLEKLPLTRTGRLRTLVALALLVALLASSLLFWQDVSAAHLYISTLNPSNGAILAREDSGNGYSGDAVIAPTAGQATVFFGVAGDQPASAAQQVVELRQNGSAWQQANQFSAPLAHGTLSVTEQGDLVIESEHGLEVTTPGGQLLWRMTGDQPARGAHAFQPTFNSDTLYTVKSAATGQIAAYDLQHGSLRWTTSLNDTLNYTPPLLLAGTTLYVAGDHAIFALNSSNGSLLWTAPHAARTLLLSGNGAHQLLIAASADGLLALNTGDGSSRWTFYGQAAKMTATGMLSLTPAQFYQASATDTTIFATGIAWKMPEIQPELWLYALDATTGKVRWSRQLTSSIISTDAGRVFTPLADSAHHLVLLEQQMDSGTLALAAYDASSGQPRWQAQFQHTNAASPSLLALSNNALLFIDIQADRGSALSVMTPVRLLLPTMMLLSILGLLLLLLFPRRIRQRRLLMAQRQLTSAWNITRLRRSARKLPAIALLIIVIATGTGVVGYEQLNQERESVSLIDMHSGATRWQQATLASTEALATGEQGSILSVADGENMHRVQAIDTGGAIHWQTFASAGTFSIPAVPTQPGTLLLALSGHIPLHDTFAPADPAYPSPADSLFILSLLNRNTGQPLWQSAIVNPGDQQNAAVLGADNHFIYVASIQTKPPDGSSGAAIQLLAVDQTSGQVSWRVFGPQEPLNMPRDNGALLLQGRRILWQVEGSVYAIDSLMGQIAWRRSFGSDNAHTLLQEEGQQAEANNRLLVARSQSIYAIDAVSGNELWTVSVPGPYTPHSTSGLGLDGNTLLVYGNGQVEAIDLASHNLIWTRKLLASIHALKVAASGKQIYLALDDSNAPGQMLMALDSRTGATLWRFQPADQASFTGAGIIEEQGILLTTFCTPETGSQACVQENLYALNATTGAVSWQVTATSISNISISPDSSMLLLQKAGSIL